MKVLLFVVALSLVACNKKTQFDVELPKGFVEFYDRFHDDSIYQMDHILFPLEGLPAGGGNALENNFKWGKDGWLMHKAFDDSEKSEYIRHIYAIDSNIVVEKINLKTNDYGMERRFAKSNDQWQLIYYAAMNRLVSNISQDTTEE